MYIQPYQNNFYSLDNADGVTVRFDNISTLDGPGHGTAGTPDADNDVYVYLQIELTNCETNCSYQKKKSKSLYGWL